MIQKALTHLLLLVLLCIWHPALAQDEAPAPIKETDILPYLEQVIAWQRAVADTELLPDNAREVLLKDRLRMDAKNALQKSFEFARAQTVVKTPAEVASNLTDEKAQTRHARLLKAATEAYARVAALQDKLRSRGIPVAQREKLNGDLKLARAEHELLQTMLRIFSAEGDTSGTLSDQIKALSRTVQDDPQDLSAPAKGDTTASADAPQEKRESALETDGMLRLSATMFSFSRKKSEISRLLEQTKALSDTNRAMVSSIRASLRSALAEGNALTTAGDDKGIAAYRQSLDALIVRYKQLSATIIPLGEMNMVLTGADRRLQEWSRLIDEDWSRIFRQLILRLIVLGVAIAVPLALSELARRATRRYIQDPKRARQLRIARRIILIAVLTFVILANFISEFGSLATFAGFITAGLAVALQTVLVSLVAHFFFFGRYGVRAGDRITVSGVTGDVVQVGMLRLYIRELVDSEGKLVPTGKMVAFPNSILFQPTAFYKHVEEK